MSMMPCDGYCYGSSVSVCKVFLSFSVLAAGKRCVSSQLSANGHRNGRMGVCRDRTETQLVRLNLEPKGRTIV